MKASDISSFLKENVSLFRDFADAQLAELVVGGRVVSVEAIAHCGDDARFLGVVLEGELVASAPGEGGRPEELLRFKAGDTFGELALMTGDKVTADLNAATRSRVLEILAALFQTAILTAPAALQRVSKTVTERLKQMMADPAKSAAALNRSADPYGLRLQTDQPQTILVINCGSSSVKYSFFDTTSDANHASSMIERIGTAGKLALDRGGICALRHIHMPPADALRYGVRDKSVVRVRVEGDRELIFGDVLVRVDPNFALAMHLDTDEANAANLRDGMLGHIDGIQSDPQNP